VHYLLSVIIDESAPPPSGEEDFGRVGEVNDAMKDAGTWVFAGGLLPSSNATVVREVDGSTTVTDGPFAETKEQLGGFWVIDATDLDAALAWAARATVACRTPIEVRPFDGLA
jgi:hypothetical protein